MVRAIKKTENSHHHLGSCSAVILPNRIGWTTVHVKTDKLFSHGHAKLGSHTHCQMFCRHPWKASNRPFPSTSLMRVKKFDTSKQEMRFCVCQDMRVCVFKTCDDACVSKMSRIQILSKITFQIGPWPTPLHSKPPPSSRTPILPWTSLPTMSNGTSGSRNCDAWIHLKSELRPSEFSGPHFQEPPEKKPRWCWKTLLN